tara:strand:+ start:1340 stop:1795 length:456 start_codon:yes stop_codon:yes gene_type:complete
MYLTFENLVNNINFSLLLLCYLVVSNSQASQQTTSISNKRNWYESYVVKLENNEKTTIFSTLLEYVEFCESRNIEANVDKVVADKWQTQPYNEETEKQHTKDQEELGNIKALLSLQRHGPWIHSGHSWLGQPRNEYEWKQCNIDTLLSSLR